MMRMWLDNVCLAQRFNKTFKGWQKAMSWLQCIVCLLCGVTVNDDDDDDDDDEVFKSESGDKSVQTSFIENIGNNHVFET